MDELQQVEIKSANDLRVWLSENHTLTVSVWLVTYKKASPENYVSTNEVLDELVSFGWTDGTRRVLDETRTMQLICRRKTKTWAKSYRDRAERLMSEGRMHHSGLQTVEEAQSTGAWFEMAEVDALVIPTDLKDSLSSFDKATDFFEGFPPSAKRNILRWIESAKTSETRSKRVLLTAQNAAKNIRIATNSAPKSNEAKRT